MHVGAALATAFAGTIHTYLGAVALALGYRFSNTTVILFLVGGIVQLFWVLPILMRWGKIWYSVGMAGTASFMTIWVITRIPGNMITHTGGEVDILGRFTETVQLTFVGLSAIILLAETLYIKVRIGG
jgi:hypothetical protein